MKNLVFIWGVGLAMAGTAWAQPGPRPQDNRGLLGVYVTNDDFGGMAIEGFIRNTPASKLNVQGQINRGDAIVRLAGRDVTDIRSLTRARNMIPFDKEGKMVLRDRRNNYYFVWIGRKNPSQVRATAAREAWAPEKVRAESSDNVRFGGRGTGEDEADIRDPKTGEAVKAAKVDEAQVDAELQENIQGEDGAIPAPGVEVIPNEVPAEDGDASEPSDSSSDNPDIR